MNHFVRTVAIALCATTAFACSPSAPVDGGTDVATGSDTADVSDDVVAVDAAPDVEMANGCPVLRAPQGMAGDPAMGDTYAAFMAPLIQANCVRCHSSTLTGAMRNGAPEMLNWDVEATVRANLPLIRNAVGVLNYMPFNPPPTITCDQRRHVVRWIDIGAP